MVKIQITHVKRHQIDKQRMKDRLTYGETDRQTEMNESYVVVLGT